MVQIENISNKYGTKEVLKNVSISIGKGESWVLFGADDAGKTTLLHLLMGYNTLYQGNLQVLGSRPDRLSRQQWEKIRYIPDGILREEDTSGIQFCKYAEKVTTRYDARIQQQLCVYFKLPMEKKLMEMSYQENKLIQIITSLAARPELLIMDEPMNLLEEDIWKKVLECIEFYNKKGMTVLIASEEYEDVLGKCRHYAYLRDGRLITGDASENMGRVKRVTAIRGNTSQSSFYKGDVTKLQNVLVRAGFSDWTIEKLTLREELDMEYAAQKKLVN